MNEIDDIEMSMGRVEAFSDGVFAVAVTLLVLNIQVPHLPESADSTALVNELPTLATSSPLSVTWG